MKIVFLQDDFPPESLGGAGFSTYELAQGMLKRGHAVFVITTTRIRENAGEHEFEGLKVVRIFIDTDPRWRAYTSLYNPQTVHLVDEALKIISPDIVHINNVHLYLSYYCFKLARKYARGVVFTARDTMSVMYGKLDTEAYLQNRDSHTTWFDHIKQAKKEYNPFRNHFIRRYLKYAQGIVAVSESLAEALRRNYIPNVAVIHTGVDESDWIVSTDEKTTFEANFDLVGKKVILFAGRLSKGKGGLKIIEALTQIVAAVPDAVLLVAGKRDAYAEHMLKTVDDKGISAHIAFTGWISRAMVRRAYAASHVVVVPSLYLDPFPRIVIEGMASQKPIVGTCYGGSPEIIVDNVTGFVVNPTQSEVLAEKIIELLKDSQKADSYGFAGKQRVREKFSLAKMLDQYEMLYAMVLNQRKEN